MLMFELMIGRVSSIISQCIRYYDKILVGKTEVEYDYDIYMYNIPCD